jgi:F-type H+-transporting ATPase subunit b
MQIFELDPGLFLWSVFTFLILVFLLYKFAFGPLMELQRKRQEDIHESIREAERLRQEAHQLLADYREQLAHARQEAEDIMDSARKVGESTRNEIIADTRLQTERTLGKAREQIERETRHALQQLKEDVADLTIAATEKVTRKTLTEADHLRLIKESVAEIDLGKVSEN